MLERQLELDRLRGQTDDLARRKPATPGIDNLQLQMSDLGMHFFYAKIKIQRNSQRDKFS